MAHFQNLIVYQLSKDLVKFVYTKIKEFPAEERYALCEQLRRSVISIPSNIAEGMGSLHFAQSEYPSPLTFKL